MQNILPPKVTEVTLTNNQLVAVELDAPARGRIHRLSVARVSTGSSGHTTAYLMDVALFTIDTVAAGISVSAVDGRRARYQVGNAVSVGDIGDVGQHPVIQSDIGIPYSNHASSRSDAVRKLYLEIRGGNNVAGDYEITLLVSAT